MFGGMTGRAEDAIRYKKAYSQIAADMMEEGKTPPPFEEWVKEFKMEESAEKENQMQDGFNSVRGKR